MRRKHLKTGFVVFLQYFYSTYQLSSEVACDLDLWSVQMITSDIVCMLWKAFEHKQAAKKVWLMAISIASGGCV